MTGCSGGKGNESRTVRLNPTLAPAPIAVSPNIFSEGGSGFLGIVFLGVEYADG